MIRIERYKETQNKEWDRFIDESINGSFILKRTYMDYHKDRFIDNSYLVYDGGKLVALFAAAYSNDSNILIAHGGLTYGGLIINRPLHYFLIEEIYTELIKNIFQNRFEQMIIKPVPRTFSYIYTETEQFYFYKRQFEILSQDINSFIALKYPIRISHNRKENIQKAIKNNLKVYSTDEISAYRVFWEILTQNLQNTYKVKPVHTIDEILYIKELNRDNIKLYVCRSQTEILAGILLFEDLKKGFVHTQYISSNEDGRKTGANDAIIYQIIQDYKDKTDRLSFGISSVKGEINSGLLLQKEGYGTIADIFKTYCIVPD